MKVVRGKITRLHHPKTDATKRPIIYHMFLCGVVRLKDGWYIVRNSTENMQFWSGIYVPRNAHPRKNTATNKANRLTGVSVATAVVLLDLDISAFDRHAENTKQ